MKYIILIVLFFNVKGFFYQGNDVWKYEEFVVMADNINQAKTNWRCQGELVEINEVTNYQWLYQQGTVYDARY